MKKIISNQYVAGLFVTIAAGLILYYGFGIGKPVQNLKANNVSEISTTTLNLFDIYNRAFSYEILADRQDFFNKYINSNVYGDGDVLDISKLGDRYILEISIGNYSIICPQEKTENFERQYPLLKGKSVRFYGIFIYKTYFGYGDNKLVIDNCSFEIK